jgi:hypothetical protein
MKAKQNIEWVQKQVSKKEGFLKSFLNTLDEMAPENAQEKLLSNKETHKM